MQNFNAAIGGSEGTVNHVLGKLFEILKPLDPSLFSFTIDIDSVGIGSVDIELTQAPTVTLKATIPDIIKAEVLKEAKSAIDSPSKDQVNSALTAVAQSTVNINFPALEVRLHYNDPHAKQTSEKIVASLVAYAGMQVDMLAQPPSATLKALSGTASTSTQALDGILNNAIIPHFLPLINEKLLDRIRIPTLRLPGVNLSAPSTVVVDGFIVAYSAIGQFPPAIPAKSIAWPREGVFVYADPNFIVAATEKPIQEHTNKSDSFREGPFSGKFNIGIAGVEGINISNDGGVSATVPVFGTASVTFDIGWRMFPTISFNAKVYGHASITAHAGIDHNRLWALINSVDSIVLDLNVGDGGKPWAWAPGFVQNAIEGAIGHFQDKLLNGILKPQVQEILGNKRFDLTEIKPIDIDLGTFKASIGLNNISLSGDNTTGDMYLVANAGLPSITVTKK